MNKDFGIFIGLSYVPAYTNLAFNADDFINNVLNKTYEGYYNKLNDILKDKNYLKNNDLYTPIHFYALGNFDIISLCLIDDFYFGNFHYRPYSENVNNVNNTNFQYQVLNCLNPEYSKDLTNFHHFKCYNFISICRIKINPSFLFEKGFKIHEILFDFLKCFLNLKKETSNFEFIISDSYSWHEFTIILFSNSLTTLLQHITQLREINSNLVTELPTISDKLNHIFIDTHSTFGISPNLFKSKDILDKYEKEYKNFENIEYISKLQLKTGHGNELIKLLKIQLNYDIYNENIKITDGRSDLTLLFKNLSFYIKFWNSLNLPLSNSKNKDSKILNHIRKIHTNLNLPFELYKPSIECDLELDTTKSTLLFDEYKFKPEEIIKIKNNLQLLNISKELRSSVISAYSNFNDLITDINLFQYFIDIRSILQSLLEIIKTISLKIDTTIKYDEKSSIGKNIIFTEKDQLSHKYNNVFEISDFISCYIDIWQIAFQNRFQESKRYGYNSDSKVEFNGGVHQIIQSYDSLFKMIVQLYQIPKDIQPDLYLPIATYGRQSIGIRSTLNNLHLNYIQLFHPEMFLFTVPKEVFNQQLQRYFFRSSPIEEDTNDLMSIKDGLITPIVELRTEIARKLNDESNLLFKKMLFDFCAPEYIEERISYISTYATWINNIYVKKNGIDNFVFWFWITFLQTSENYNINGTIRLSVFRKTFFDFALALHIILPNYELKKVIEIINSPILKYFLTKPLPIYKKNIFECLENLKDYFEKHNLLQRIQDIYSFLMQITELKTKKNKTNNQYLDKIQNITDEYISFYRKLVLNNSNIIAFRDYQGENNNILFDNNDLLFDFHGGLISRNPKHRMMLFQKRNALFKSLFELGMEFKFIKKYKFIDS